MTRIASNQSENIGVFAYDPCGKGNHPTMKDGALSAVSSTCAIGDLFINSKQNSYQTDQIWMILLMDYH